MKWWGEELGGTYKEHNYVRVPAPILDPFLIAILAWARGGRRVRSNGKVYF
jgi:hypothetical protein